MCSRTSSSLVDVYFPCCSQPCQTNLYYSTTELSICLGHAAANSAAFKSLITNLCRSWKHCSLQPIQPHSSHLSQVFVSLMETLFAAVNSAAFKSLILSLCRSWKHCSLRPIQPHSSHLSQAFVSRGSNVLAIGSPPSFEPEALLHLSPI
jgi:hypothetical protein